MKKLYSFTSGSFLIAIFLMISSVAISQNTYFGNVNYHGNSNTPVPEVTVTVSSLNGSFSAFATTGADGSFSIENIPYGDFTVSAETNQETAPITLNDAYLVLMHLFGVITLDDYQTLAADVNANNMVDWGDYWDILIGYMMYNTPFVADEWLFDAQPISFVQTKDGGHILGGDLGATCSGDIGGVWIPDEKISPNAQILNTETLSVLPGETFDVTFTASSDMSVAGLYLGIIYNADIISIEGYETTPAEMEYRTEETNGLLGFNWMVGADMQALNIAENDAVITLTVTIADDAEPQEVVFSLDDESSYIAANGKTFAGAPLFTQSLKVLNDEATTSIDEQQNSIQIYPNPATDYIVVNHNNTQTASFIIRDLTGKTIHQSSLSNGNNTIDVSAFAPGYYLYQYIDQNTSNPISGSFVISK